MLWSDTIFKTLEIIVASFLFINLGTTDKIGTHWNLLEIYIVVN